MTSPIEKIMTPAGECKVFTKDIAMHWYPNGARKGDTCFCGKVTKKE